MNTAFYKDEDILPIFKYNKDLENSTRAFCRGLYETSIISSVLIAASFYSSWVGILSILLLFILILSKYADETFWGVTTINSAFIFIWLLSFHSCKWIKKYTYVR